MKKNMGVADKLIRLAVAAVIAILFLAGAIKGALALVLVLGIAAIILAATALVSFCPLYLPFGISTKK